MNLAIVTTLVILCALLTLTSYAERVYAEIGKFLSREFQDNIDSFERQVEPRLKVSRTRAALSMSLLTQLLMAAIAALEALKRPAQVRLTTDSQYVKQGIEAWVPRWIANGWRTADRKPVKNQDLWQRLAAAAARHDVSWHWTRGHSGHPENERVDVAACDAARAVAEAATRVKD